MTHDVFISYSSKDQKIVEGLSAYLEQQDVRCFVAYRDIPKGKVWAAEITKAIENCKCMVVVFSENFNSSDQVDREIELCFEEGKTIIPLKIQDSRLSGAKKYYLKNINWIDAFPEPEKYFGELFTAINSLLSPAGKRVPTKMESNTVDISQSTASSFQHILKIRTNLSCQVFVDGEMKTTIEADKITKIPLNKGSYYLEFISIKDNSDNYSCNYRISDVEELLTVDLKSIEKERVRLENLELDRFYKNEKWGFRDKHTDKVIIPLKYDAVWDFSEGLAKVKLNDRWGFINKAGKEVVPLIYDEVCLFSEGLAKVKLHGKWGFIDKAGKEVIPLKYSYVGTFYEGLAYVSLNNEAFYLDKQDNRVDKKTMNINSKEKGEK